VAKVGWLCVLMNVSHVPHMSRYLDSHKPLTKTSHKTSRKPHTRPQNLLKRNRACRSISGKALVHVGFGVCTKCVRMQRRLPHLGAVPTHKSVFRALSESAVPPPLILLILVRPRDPPPPSDDARAHTRVPTLPHMWATLPQHMWLNDAAPATAHARTSAAVPRGATQAPQPTHPIQPSHSRRRNVPHGGRRRIDCGHVPR
jgi:hypothetical protein